MRHRLLSCRVLLTVLKTNISAINFYKRLRYSPDETSPSSEYGAPHEILSKVVHPAAVDAKKHIFSAFEEGRIPAELIEQPLALPRPSPAAAPASAGSAVNATTTTSSAAVSLAAPALPMPAGGPSASNAVAASGAEA